MGLVDVDGLVLRCRDENARLYICEAVSCYKSGAYRACIVSTWNSVVFDFLHKLRELELTGDAKAKSILKRFEEIRVAGEARLKDALEFERDIINVALEDFELLTPIEAIDLERLRDDRNRCAHPSMLSDGVPYNPTAELARTHLRAAVEILLEKEPVQGKAAFARICDDIKSEYFPKQKTEAVVRLSEGPLKRARRPLIKNLIVGITKSILNEECGLSESKRQRTALAAIIEIHRGISEEVLKIELPKIVSALADDHLAMLIVFCKNITEAWEILPRSVQQKLLNYVTNQPSDNKLVMSLAGALYIDELKAAACSRVKDLPIESFALLVKGLPVPELVPLVIEMFQNVLSFRRAEYVIDNLVIPMSRFMRAGDVVKVLTAIASNSQIWDASGIQGSIVRFFEETQHVLDECKDDWIELLRSLDVLYWDEDKSEWYKTLKEHCSQLQSTGPVSEGVPW